MSEKRARGKGRSVPRHREETFAHYRSRARRSRTMKEFHRTTRPLCGQRDLPELQDLEDRNQGDGGEHFLPVRRFRIQQRDDVAGRVQLVDKIAWPNLNGRWWSQ